jgi:integrase
MDGPALLAPGLRRLIVLGEATLERLRKHRELQEFENAAAGKRWREGGLMFLCSIGGPMESRNLVCASKRMLRAAGLPNVRFHDLRHTAATLMLHRGLHPKVVQERLGHSEISMTLDI